MILNEYTDHRKPEQTNLDLRDMTLEILSDSIVVAPVLQTAALHAKVRKNSFVYVFKQQTVDGYHPEVGKMLRSLVQFVSAIWSWLMLYISHGKEMILKADDFTAKGHKAIRTKLELVI